MTWPHCAAKFMLGQRRINRDRTTIDWKFTRKQARRKLHYSTTRARY